MKKLSALLFFFTLASLLPAQTQMGSAPKSPSSPVFAGNGRSAETFQGASDISFFRNLATLPVVERSTPFNPQCICLAWFAPARSLINLACTGLTLRPGCGHRLTLSVKRNLLPAAFARPVPAWTIKLTMNW